MYVPGIYPCLSICLLLSFLFCHFFATQLIFLYIPLNLLLLLHLPISLFFYFAIFFYSNFLCFLFRISAYIRSFFFLHPSPGACLFIFCLYICKMRETLNQKTCKDKMCIEQETFWFLCLNFLVPKVKKVKKSTFGGRSFSFTAPYPWNQYLIILDALQV